MAAPAVAYADTACYIYVAGDCHGWVPSQTWFYDDYNGASSNNSTCIHRAREFAIWCGLGNPGDQVNAAFNLDGMTISAQAFKPADQDQPPTTSTYGFNWAPLVTSPVEGIVAGNRPSYPPVVPRLDARALPLGNQMYVSDGPHQGYVYVCDPRMFQQYGGPGASAQGAWLNEIAGTYDVTQKPAAQGQVFFSDAYLSIVASGGQRLITSNGLPLGVPTGLYPVSPSDPTFGFDQNPNTISQQSISFGIPLNPSAAPADSCVYKEVGITIDGVPLHAPFDSTGRNELAYEIQDACNGGPQPGGGYHRHAFSNCTPHIHERAMLVGYALDGFGIYGPIDENGTEITSADLDECHGRTSPVVWEGQWVNMYHYVMTRDFPYTIACFKGTPTRNAFPPLPGAPPQH
jgi:hypothetical protein